MTTKALLGAPYVIVAPPVAGLNVGDHFVLVALGLIAAAIGVGAMRAAALLERGFAATRAPSWARPVLGGLILAAMALYTPQVLGAGHGAVGLDFSAPLSAATLATLLALKLSASLISLASGFRGGLFFASLFAGALLGKLYALGVAAVLPTLGLDPTACIMAGMGTLSIATSLAVRATFGYSFTTWRLHLRGESIRGAQDIGWLRDLTVGRLMVSAPPTIRADTSLRAFRAAYPLGSAHVVVAVDEAERYRGLVLVPEAHAAPLTETEDGGPISAVARLPETSLHPDIDARSALAIFDAAQSDTLAVTERETDVVLGTLSEAFAARRYAQETDQAARGVLGGG